MWANQTAVVQPRLIPSQFPWGLKFASSSSGTPILSLWVSKNGTSSTRSVVTFNGSVMLTAYRIFKILSLFDRTMSLWILKETTQFLLFQLKNSVNVCTDCLPTAQTLPFFL